jgi:hypothetical protein
MDLVEMLSPSCVTAAIAFWLFRSGLQETLKDCDPHLAGDIEGS